MFPTSSVIEENPWWQGFPGLFEYRKIPAKAVSPAGIMALCHPGVIAGNPTYLIADHHGVPAVFGSSDIFQTGTALQCCDPIVLYPVASSDVY